MTVKQLIEKLKQYPDDMDVFMAERRTDFGYGLLNSVESKEIGMTEEPDGEVLARETVVILDED